MLFGDKYKFHAFFYQYGNKQFNSETFFRILLLLILFISSTPSKSQNIIGKIESTSRAVINATAINKSKTPVGSAMAFFISGDGLAITDASLFQYADSILFYDNNGKNFALNQIIAFHPYGNMALVHLQILGSKPVDFLTPSFNAFNGESEILAFMNIADSNQGLSYGRINKITESITGDRIVYANLRGSSVSNCAPNISNNGDFIGISRFIEDKSIIFPSKYIADSLWISVNQTLYQFKSNSKRNNLTDQILCLGMISLAEENWTEAARCFTESLKTDPNNATIYALRALCKYKYGNKSGGNDDFSYSIKLKPDGYLPYYARAFSHIINKDINKALADLFLSVEKHPDFARAFIEIGKLQISNNEISRAFASFTYALKTDSLLAEAWYERGRLSMFHSSNQNKALADLLTAAQLNPWLDGIYSLCGNIKLKQKNYLDAIIDFDKAINKNPEDIHARMNRGMAYFNIGLKDKACDDWEYAVKKGDTQAIILSSRYCTQLR